MAAALAGIDWIPTIIGITSGGFWTLSSMPIGLLGLLGKGPGTPTDTKVRLWVGKPHHADDSHGSANLPDVYTYDSWGQVLTKNTYREDKVPEGSFWDYIMETEDDDRNESPEYIILHHSESMRTPYEASLG
jgi:hypothetical protein